MFAPLPSRLRSHTALSESTNPAAATPSSASAAVQVPKVTNPFDAVDGNSPPDENAPAKHSQALAVVRQDFSDDFLCHNRKCTARRERRKKEPRHLFSAHWRAMKVGKHQTLVLDLTICCPDCGFEHHATLVPPEWQDVPK